MLVTQILFSAVGAIFLSYFEVAVFVMFILKHFFYVVWYLVNVFIFHQSLPLTYGYGALYVTLVGITLGLIKLTNYRLHLTFNANLPDEPPNQESTGAAAPSAEADDASSPTTRSNHDNNAEVSHRAQESARPHNSVVSQVTEVIDDNDLTAAGCTASSLEAVSENVCLQKLVCTLPVPCGHVLKYEVC